MNIKQIIKEEVNRFVNEEYSDNLLYGYHVTYKENVESIFNNGFKVGGASMQGKGVYGFYNLDNVRDYATKTNKDTVIIKFSLNPNNILIFDPKIAKDVLGDEYLITDQIKKLDYNSDILKRSTQKFKNPIPVEEFEKKINTYFLNNERNWWTSYLIMQYEELGTGRLFEGEYGMTYVITRPSNLNLIGYYDMTFAKGRFNFSNELKTVSDDRIINHINKDDTYNQLKTNINIYELKSIVDINKMINYVDNALIKVRNNREYDLYDSIIKDLNRLKKEIKTLPTDTTDYSQIRGIH